MSKQLQRRSSVAYMQLIAAALLLLAVTWSHAAITAVNHSNQLVRIRVLASELDPSKDLATVDVAANDAVTIPVIDLTGSTIALPPASAAPSPSLTPMPLTPSPSPVSSALRRALVVVNVGTGAASAPLLVADVSIVLIQASATSPADRVDVFRADVDAGRDPTAISTLALDI